MKKTIAILLCLVMLLSLVACAKSTSTAPAETETTTETPAAEAETPATEEATEAPAEETAPADGDITSWIVDDDTSISGTVRFWMPFKGEQGMDAMIADFNKTYPNIKVELTSYSNNADGNLSVNTAIMSGEVDVLGSFGLANTYLRWENGLYEDLTEKLNAENVDLVANWGTDAYNYEGAYYTIPCGGMSYYVCINMDAWNEAGLGDIPTEWTWDDYLAACKAMTKVADDGTVEVYGGADNHSIECFTFAKYQVTGFNNFYDEETGLSSFGMDVIKNSLNRELQAELVDKIWFPKAVYRSDDLSGQDTFPCGKVASCVSNNMIRFLRDTENYPVDYTVAFAPYPTEEAGQTNYMAGVGYFSHLGITTGCQDEAAAWAFTKWFSTYGSKYLVVAGHQSTWKGTEGSEVLSLIFGSEEDAAKIIDVESFERVVGNTANPGYIDTISTVNSEVSSILKNYALSAMNGEISGDEAMAAAQAEADAAIQDAQ